MRICDLLRTHALTNGASQRPRSHKSFEKLEPNPTRAKIIFLRFLDSLGSRKYQRLVLWIAFASLVLLQLWRRGEGLQRVLTWPQSEDSLQKSACNYPESLYAYLPRSLAKTSPILCLFPLSQVCQNKTWRSPYPPKFPEWRSFDWFSGWPITESEINWMIWTYLISMQTWVLGGKRCSLPSMS